MSSLNDNLSFDGGNVVEIDVLNLLLEGNEKRKELIDDTQKQSSSDDFTRTLSPGEDNDSFYSENNPDTDVEVALEVRVAEDKQKKEENNPEPEVVDPEKDIESKKESSSFEEKTSLFLEQLEKRMGDVYLSEHSKQTELKTLKKLHEVLKPFNRDFSQFLVFMNQFSKNWYVERSLFLMFLTCLMLDHPEYYCSCFDSDYFSSTAQNGYGDLIAAFINAAKEFNSNRFEAYTSLS